MPDFQPEKLTVTFLPPTTPFLPADGRKYTLTHSDETGNLFLSIGTEFDTAALGEKHDEVLAEWKSSNGQYYLAVNLYISGGEYNYEQALMRYRIFRQELSLALKAIIFGDQEFYRFFPWLVDCPIYVRFLSNYPEMNQVECYGTPRHYHGVIIEKDSSYS